MNTEKTRVLRALGLSVAGKYVTQLLAFASVVIVARLLTPAQIGEFSLAAAIVAVAYELRAFGVNFYIIQLDRLTDEAVRAATGVLYITSWSFGILLLAGASPAAGYFSVPVLRELLRPWCSYRQWRGRPGTAQYDAETRFRAPWPANLWTKSYGY